jgi:hypothetical protein
LLYIVAAVGMADQAFAGGSVLAAHSDGSQKKVPLPLDKRGVGNSVREMKLVDATGATTRVSFEPACDVPSDGVARVVLAQGAFKASAPAHVTMTTDLPGDVTYLAGPSQIPFESDFKDWFTFRPDERYDEPSEIGMEDWLETPAGKHGHITRQDDKLIYHGKPIKLWGLNLCFGTCAPEKQLAEKRAKFYAKYGVNAVRLHKYADGSGWAGIQSQDSFVEFDPEGLDRMDYQIAQFKQRGIYVKLSFHELAGRSSPQPLLQSALRRARRHRRPAQLFWWRQREPN